MMQALVVLAAVFLCVGGQDQAELLKGFLESGQIKEFIDYFGKNQLDPFSLKDGQR
jgi:hypothetical protein